MCATLMNVQAAKTEELHAAVDRKLRKFGSLERMPVETRTLVKNGIAELQDRRRLSRDSVTS
jgi:hypothetical protein